MAKTNKKSQEQYSLITEMNAKKAQDFFLKNESYCNFKLPNYFDFEPLLHKMSKFFNSKNNVLKDIIDKKELESCDVNHVLQTSKDGHYAWRPMTLIHPVLYVNLVIEITKEGNWQLLIKEFEKFSKNKKINCMSVPVESTNSKTYKSDTACTLNRWWKQVEQLSIKRL